MFTFTIPICVIGISLATFFVHRRLYKNKDSYRFKEAMIWSCASGSILGFIASLVISFVLIERSISTGNVEVAVSSGLLDPFPHEDGKSVFIIKCIENGAEYIAFIIDGKKEECSILGGFCTDIVIKEQKVNLLNTYEEQVITAKGWTGWFASTKTIRIFKVRNKGIREGNKREMIVYVLSS